MTDKMILKDEQFHIVFNGRDVEMKVSAEGSYFHQKQTFWEPAYEELEVEEVIIQNAHYVDDGSLIDPETIEDAVIKELQQSDKWENVSAEARQEEEDYKEYCRCEIAEAKRKGE